MSQAVIAESFDVTTLLGSHLGLSMLLPVQFDPMNSYSLNALLNIQPHAVVNEMPRLRYFGCGIRGCWNLDDDIRSSAYNPRRTNMNLYRPIPIRCRPIDEDLTPEERALYRMRQRKTLSDGNEYFLYWLKLCSFSDTIKFKRINPATGREEAIELDPSNLQPTPVKVSDDKTLKDLTAQVVAYCEASVDLAAEEVLEYITAEFAGDTRYARISEIGFFTGIDQVVQGTTGTNMAIEYTEAICTHLYSHACWTGSSLTKQGSQISSVFEISGNGSVSMR